MTSQVQRRQQTIKSRYIRATIYTTVSCFWEWLCICFVLVFELSINILLFKALQLCGNYLHNFFNFSVVIVSKLCIGGGGQFCSTDTKNFKKIESSFFFVICLQAKVDLRPFCQGWLAFISFCKFHFCSVLTLPCIQSCRKTVCQKIFNLINVISSEKNHRLWLPYCFCFIIS